MGGHVHSARQTRRHRARRLLLSPPCHPLRLVSSCGVFLSLDVIASTIWRHLCLRRHTICVRGTLIRTHVDTCFAPRFVCRRRSRASWAYRASCRTINPMCDTTWLGHVNCTFAYLWVWGCCLTILSQYFPILYYYNKKRIFGSETTEHNNGTWYTETA